MDQVTRWICSYLFLLLLFYYRSSHVTPGIKKKFAFFKLGMRIKKMGIKTKTGSHLSAGQDNLGQNPWYES